MVVVGGGHNGLVAAAYLSRLGVSTAVLERRPVLGGAAVTEEIVPGYKFSRSDTAELSLVLASPHTVLSLVIGISALTHAIKTENKSKKAPRRGLKVP